MAHGVPKAITFIRLSRSYHLLEQRDIQSKERFRQRALAQLRDAFSTIELIRDAPIRLNMLVILGRQYEAMGERAMAQIFLGQSLQLLKKIQISDSSQSLNLLGLLSDFQARLGQFDAAWATITLAPGTQVGYAGRDWNRSDLILEMLKSRSPEAVLPYIQKMQEPEGKAQALGAVAIAFAKRGQSTQGRKILEQAISIVPLDKHPVDIAHPFPFDGSPPKKATIDFRLIFPLVSNYAKAGQMESALEIAQGTRSAALIMAIKAVMANEYARKGDARAPKMMDEVKIQMDQASQDDTYPVVKEVFSELMDNHQYRFAWGMTQAVDAEAWESYLRALTSTAPLSWPFLEKMSSWQTDIIKAAIADKRYDIALEAARNDHRLVRMATPASLEVGLVEEVLSAARRTDHEERAGVLAAISLKLEQQGHLERAKPVWTEAITAAQQLKEGTERAKALMGVIAKLQHTKHQSQVDMLLQQVITIDKAYRNDASYRWNPLIQDLMEFLLMSEDPHLAMRLVAAMTPDAHRERNRIFLFQNLLSFFDESIPEAEVVLATMPRSVFKVRSQIALAEAYFTWGQFQQSSAALNQALNELKQITEAEIVKARRTLSDVFVSDRNTTPWLTKKDSRSSLLGYIALGYTKMQNSHRTTQVIQMMPHEQIQRQWRSHLACYRRN